MFVLHFFYISLWHLTFNRDIYSIKCSLKIKELVERDTLTTHVSPRWSYGAVCIVGLCAGLFAFRCFQAASLEDGVKGVCVDVGFFLSFVFTLYSRALSKSSLLLLNTRFNSCLLKGRVFLIL